MGTGNIVGVATAIAIGGPGALFWMWRTGLALVVLVGGIKSIGKVTSAFVPIMIVFYVVAALFIFAVQYCAGWE